MNNLNSISTTGNTTDSAFFASLNADTMAIHTNQENDIMHTDISTETACFDANGNELFPGTNLTVEAVGAMYKDFLRDERIDRILGVGRKHKVRRARRSQGNRPLSDAAFQALTGWTRQDALEMALDCRKEDRLHGTALYN